MITPKLIIAKSGKSITSTDPMDYIFRNDLQTVIVYMEGLRQVSVSANSTAKDTVYFKDINMDQNQDMGYYPIVKISVELNPGSGVYYLSPFTFAAGDGTDIYIVQTSASDTGVKKDQFFITFKNTTGSSKTVKYYYRVFANIG